MDSPPVPKPRSTFWIQNDPSKQPVPLPRTKVPSNDENGSASDIMRSISSISKQLTEDVANKVSSSAKSANEKLEKTFQDSSKFAKDTIEKTLSTSRAVRDSVTRSVIDGTLTSLRKKKSKKTVVADNIDSQRCVSMPVVEVGLFDNIQFHSPLLEQKEYGPEIKSRQNQDLPALNLNSSHLDDLSIFSNNSDSNPETVSNFSYDSKDNEAQPFTSSDYEQLTYDTPKGSRTNSVLSVSTPDVPERRKKKEKNIDTALTQNLHYENWILPCQSTPPENTTTNSTINNVERVSKSTIYEFDPLTSSSSSKLDGFSNELLLLQSFLIGDTYGSIMSSDSFAEESFDEYRESEYFNPPTPPERLDSLFTNNDNNGTSSTSSTDKDSNSNWFLLSEIEPDAKSTTSTDSKTNHSVIQKFSSILKLDYLHNKSTKQGIPKVNVVEKPPLNNLLVPYYSGMLTRIVPGVVEDLFKNSQNRYCVLSEQKLLCYTDATNSVLKEAYNLDYVTSLQIVLPLSSSNSHNTYCYELMYSTGGLRTASRKVQFSCTSASDRRNWAQKISEHLSREFPTKYTAEFTRCGWSYLKEGVSGEWRGAWMMLVRRVIVYYTSANPTIQTVDLRKTRCVVTQTADEETKSSCPSDCEHNLVLDCPHATIYLRFPYERELKGWKFMIKLAAHNNGAQLHHQQLTKEDVPTIVDKCLSFIYAHGSLSEGIYRRAGSNAVLAELLARFRRDAWSVQLSPAEHSEHDVAGVLKRFFRDLPEPPITADKQKALIVALRIEDETARISEYRRLMLSLPLVARNTMRKLFAHLHFLDTLSHANKMSAENLAALWGPNIMPGIIVAWSSKEMFVVRDLIVKYESVWQPTAAESAREAAVRRVLVRALSAGAQQHAAHAPPAGDLRLWLYLNDKNNCYQVTLTPNKTSGDVCIELSEKAKIDSHLLMVEEVVCNESMRRMVHVDEILLDVVLRWGYWDEEDRKDNYLLLKENKILQDIENLKNNTSLVCGELKFANATTKTFKSHMFELQNSKLSYFKDKQGSHKLEGWDVKDILWYSGHEPKRNPQSRWAITFIPKVNKPNRSKERPWFGCTIAGSVTADQLKWMTGLMFAEHTKILPTPRLVIT